MTAARRKRLEDLEARQPRGTPWTDPFDAAIALWSELQAVAAGRACWIPLPEPELAPEFAERLERTLRESDRVAERLKAEPGA